MKATRIAMLSIVVLGAIATPLWAGAPIRYGLFDQADFTPPDFADGATATVTAGESRTFTFACHCADQPKTVPCYGSILLQVDDGSGYTTVDSAACSIPELGWCPVTQVHTFYGEGSYAFRIVCDEAAGTDYTQGVAEIVNVTVTAAGCTNGSTRPCPLQEGVCAASVETCAGGVWQGDCSYDLRYEEPELSCDFLDNDCDGTADNVDMDDDGFVACPGVPDVVNELLLTSTDGIGGSIQILEYRDGAYEEAWRSVAPDVPYNSDGGGEAGDLTDDSIPEFAIVRAADPVFRLEIWTPDGDGWRRLWSIERPMAYGGLDIGDIMDFDGDGLNELLLTNRNAEALELYGFDGSGFALEATVRDCSAYGTYFHAAGGDMDGDGLPEIAFQCYAPDTLHVHEYTDGSYPTVAEVVLPGNPVSNPMIVDDMEHGDVNGDGRDDIVFCGNSGQGHVLTYTGGTDGTYVIEYSSPPPANPYSFSQTCSAGDITGDGVDDLLVVNREGAKVYSYDGASYQEAWVGPYPTYTPGIGTSFVGDADNDGLAEFLFVDYTPRAVRLYEGESHVNSFLFGPMVNSLGTIIVGNLNPSNDLVPVDCNDSNPVQGAFEVCGDGVDNDCDTQVDEGCPSEYCGNSYCAGSNAGETCQSCPADCGCYGPSCRFGCCGDYVCGKNENTTNCPVDCR